MRDHTDGPLRTQAAKLWRDLPRVHRLGLEWLSQQGPKFRHWPPHWLIEAGEPAKWLWVRKFVAWEMERGEE